MERYCSNCKKSFDFQIKGMNDLKNLTCPECGRPISENSRVPSTSEEDDVRAANALSNVFSFLYYFYIVIAGLGIAFYFLKFYNALFVTTAINLLFYAVMMLIGFNGFTSGLLFLPVGAVAGYIYFKTIAGACLGIQLTFAAYHIIRDVIWRLIYALVKFLSKLGS